VDRDLYGRKSEDRERPERAERPLERKRSDRELFGRKQSLSVKSDLTANQQTAAVATAGIIVPNKSTMAEEEIEIPYGREQRESASTAIDTAESEQASPLGGLSGLTARLRADDTDGSAGVGGRSGEDYFDKMSFGRTGSAASNRSIPPDGAGSRLGNNSAAEEQETMRREYEYKIATMQSKISGLERDLSGAEESKKKARAGADRVRQMEEELDGLRRVSWIFFFDSVLGC
jgi:hypothetical protein